MVTVNQLRKNWNTWISPSINLVVSYDKNLPLIELALNVIPFQREHLHNLISSCLPGEIAYKIDFSSYSMFIYTSIQFNWIHLISYRWLIIIWLLWLARTPQLCEIDTDRFFVCPISPFILSIQQCKYLNERWVGKRVQFQTKKQQKKVCHSISIVNPVCCATTSWWWWLFRWVQKKDRWNKQTILLFGALFLFFAQCFLGNLLMFSLFHGLL